MCDSCARCVRQREQLTELRHLLAAQVVILRELGRDADADELDRRLTW